MQASSLFCAFLALLAGRVASQCGPGGARPYPPGQTSCPAMGDGMEPHPGGGPPPQGAPSAEGNACASSPCAASTLGDVGLTTATGTDSRSGITFQVGENIYGPFEAGFSSQQDGILAGLGCNPGSLGHVAGGIDTATAEQMVASQCSVVLPRIAGGQYISLLDECGGHTREYHFHEKLSCLYSQSGGHSAQVGKAKDNQYIYGKWEDYSTSTLPLLDACGGHFGITPDSGNTVVYHYHIQDTAPFTIGCFGPVTNSDGSYKLVTVSECRALYSGCGDGDTTTLTIPTGSVQYDPWCPCWDGAGSNVGTAELAVLSSGSGVPSNCTGASCTTFDGSTLRTVASSVFKLAPNFFVALLIMVFY